MADANSFFSVLTTTKTSVKGLQLASNQTNLNNTTNFTAIDICHRTCFKGFCVLDNKSKDGFKCCPTKKCRKVCIDPGNVINATKLPVRQLPRFEPGERIFYTCKFPYQFNKGNGVIMCLPTGNWNSSLPRCVCRPGPHCNYNNLNRILKQQGGDFGGNKMSNQSNSSITPMSNSQESTVIIVGVTCLTLLLIGIGSWFVYKKYKRPNSSSYMHTFKNSNLALENATVLPELKPTSLLDGAVAAKDFFQHVAIRHRNNDQGFLDEFEEIQNLEGPQPTWEASKLYENKEKNRYTNIVAYDHTRVRLRASRKARPSGLLRGSDYINANYVSSFLDPEAYIACQGPLPSTFNDFWSMVWDNNAFTIVMVTNLVEKGRRKCDQYWPQEGKEQYKHISVTLKSTESFANYTIRAFSVKNTKLTRRNARGGERRVLQYHFTQWPDHGTPEYPLPVLTFIRRSFSSRPAHAGPIVVHCSAGVGRSGTYIVIHSMMQMLEATGILNVKAFLRHIRFQRNFLVQTEDQYTFVHDALLEYITSGVTECSLSQLAPYYQSLIAPSAPASANQNLYQKSPSTKKKSSHSVPSNGVAVGKTTSAVDQPLLKNGLEKQFMKVVYSPGDTLGCDFALRSVNERKNRPGAVLPVFRSRVLLCNRTGVEGCDYINASFVQGYRDNHEFIITQLPLSSTRNDFWQLVWDHNCSTIVTIKDSSWKPDSDVYWPTSDKPLHCPSFNVTCSSEKPISRTGIDCDLATRDFIVEATKDDYVLEVRQFELSSWDTATPNYNQLEAVSAIAKFTAGKDGSTVVQDRFGCTSAAQLACWIAMQCQIENENTVDVYQTAAVAYQMRPKIFTSPSHLKFLYEAVLLEAKVRAGTKKMADEHPSSPVKLEVPSDELGLSETRSDGTAVVSFSEATSDSTEETHRLVA